MKNLADFSASSRLLSTAFLYLVFCCLRKQQTLWRAVWHRECWLHLNKHLIFLPSWLRRSLMPLYKFVFVYFDMFPNFLVVFSKSIDQCKLLHNEKWNVDIILIFQLSKVSYRHTICYSFFQDGVTALLYNKTIKRKTWLTMTL